MCVSVGALQIKAGVDTENVWWIRPSRMEVSQQSIIFSLLIYISGTAFFQERRRFFERSQALLLLLCCGVLDAFTMRFSNLCVGQGVCVNCPVRRATADPPTSLCRLCLTFRPSDQPSTSAEPQQPTSPSPCTRSWAWWVTSDRNLSNSNSNTLQRLQCLQNCKFQLLLVLFGAPE